MYHWPEYLFWNTSLIPGSGLPGVNRSILNGSYPMLCLLKDQISVLSSEAKKYISHLPVLRGCSYVTLQQSTINGHSKRLQKMISAIRKDKD